MPQIKPAGPPHPLRILALIKAHLFTSATGGSWSTPYSNTPSQVSFTKLPSYVNTLIISFVDPSKTYDGKNINSSGLQFPWSSLSNNVNFTKQAIDALKQKKPNTKVLIAVGGASYADFSKFDNSASASTAATNIAKLVSDIDADGIDIDYETPETCSNQNNQVSCSKDQELTTTITSLRKALDNLSNAKNNKHYLLSLAGFSVGAYGEGNYATAKPLNSNTGRDLAAIANPATANALDMINIMAYDAGDTSASSTGFNPTQAYDAYSNYFKKQVNLGIEIPPEAWGGHILTTQELTGLISHVKASGHNPGMMVWELTQKDPTKVNTFSQQICNGFSMGDCSSPALTSNSNKK